MVTWAGLIGLVAVDVWSAPILAPIPLIPSQQSPARPDPTGRGYMGVVLNLETLAIEMVEPDRPAARAGLQPQDVIVRVNQFHPQTTQQMIDYVCSCRPGAVLEVEVRRGSERKVVYVKLIARPSELDRTRILPPVPDEPPLPE